MKQCLENIKGDKVNILVLFSLYVLQGIPTGLYKSIPLFLTNLGVPYSKQALFSIGYYPYSSKLLWAPLVDSLYFKRFGRRKSWLIPVQTLIGITMIVLSFFIEDIFGNTDAEEGVDVKSLTAVFLILTILTSTQDIATDGWCISMLKPENVGYASTCQSVGLTIGFCIGYILFTALESIGMVTISQFLLFWGIVFLIATAMIAIFKKDNTEYDEESLGVLENYKALWKMVRHPMLLKITFFLVTYGFGVSAAESMANLKLIEKGFPKEKIALLEIPMIFVKIFVSKFTVGPKPMNVWIVAFPLRLFFCLALTLVVFIAPKVMMDDGSFPSEFYAAVIGVFAFSRAMSLAMWVAVIAFFAKISDPGLGGTYMSFFTTLNTLGSRWPVSLNLWLVDQITWKNCVDSDSTIDTTCNRDQDNEDCVTYGGVCGITFDGFYVLSIFCVVVGYIWFIWAFPAVRRWQNLQPDCWRLKNKEAKDTGEMAETRYKL